MFNFFFKKDERNMIITTNCWLNQGWIDYKLRWNPDDYNGIKVVHLPNEKVWKPDILLCIQNTYLTTITKFEYFVHIDKFKLFSSVVVFFKANNADHWAKLSSISTNVIVKYNGNVTWLSTVIFKSSCSINVKYFPFDEQTCDMIFASWTYDGFSLDLDVNSNEGDITNYIKNGEWHLVNLTAEKVMKFFSCCEEPYPEIQYKLIIRRRPLFYVFNMVFPCLLITLVAFLGFYLPPASPEKVSIGITTLLSLTVFLILASESMPPTSEQLPLISIFYLATTSIVSFSTAMAVLTLNINNMGYRGKPIPRLVKLVFFRFLAKIVRTDLHSDKQRDLILRHEASKSGRQREHRNNIAGDLNETRTLVATASKHTTSNAVVVSAAATTPLVASAILNNNNNNNHSNNNDDDDDNRLLRQSADMRDRDHYQTEYDELSTPGAHRSPSIHNGTNQLVAASNRTSSSFNHHHHRHHQCGSCDHNNEIVVDGREASIPLHTSATSGSLSTCKRTLSQRHRNHHHHHHHQHTPSVSSAHAVAIAAANQEFLLRLEQTLEKQFRPIVDMVVRTLDTNEKCLLEREKCKHIEDEWTDVAIICDHLLCFFFFIFTICACFLIFMESPHVFASW